MTNSVIKESVLNIINELVKERIEAKIKPDSITDISFHQAIKTALNELYKEKKIAVENGINHKVIKPLTI